MKKNVLQTKKALLALFAVLMPLVTSAHDFEVNGIYYNITSETDKTVEVTYKGNNSSSYSNEYSGAVTIPSTIAYNGKTYSVTSIGGSAFYGCSSLTSITIPESVTSIGNYAFGGCSSLTSITLPKSVTSIRDTAFRNCSSLTSITIPESVTSIGDWAFRDCSSLTAVHISNLEAWCNIDFGDYSANPLYYAENLYLNGELVTELTIPNTVTAIKNYAFYYCSNLTSITIPKGVTSIGNKAFSDCRSLTTITIPEGVTSIGYSALSGTAWYKNLPDGVVYIGKVLYEYKGTMPANSSIEVREGTVSISPYAFDGCTYLTSITIPESVTSIGDYAFYNCSNLTSITIPESVTSIGSYAFGNCTGLTSITCYAAIPPACGGNAFNGIYKQVPVYVPATSISKYWYADGWKEFTNYQPLVVVTDITLSQSTASLFVGEELVLTAEVAPDNAPNPTLAWSSSDPSVASVDIKGKVVALAPGTAIITATANDGSGVSASCEVIVRPAPAERCAAPVISYVGGKVVLTCTTEGAKVITTVTADNDNTFEVLSFDYIPTHTFTAYATKENYANSDEVTLTLCWIPCTEEHKEDEGTNEEGNGNDDTEEEDNGILNIPSQPVLIQCTGGTITVSGLAAGTEVKVYDTAGTQQGTATATDGTATIATNLEAGSIAIVKIGDNSIKIVIK